MKKIILFILLTVSTNVFANFYTGNDLIRWYKIDNYTGIYGYLAGVIDEYSTEPNNKKIICIPEATEIQQISQITYNYLQKNPTQWAWNGAFIVWLALIEAYPCKK